MTKGAHNHTDGIDLEAAWGVFSKDGQLISGTRATLQWLASDGIARGLGSALDAAARLGRVERSAGWGTMSVTCLEVGPQPSYLVEFRPPPAASCRLTPRQLEVCEYAAAGATVREIAATTRVGAETVRAHLKEAYRRLEVANRVELARALG